MHGGSRFSRPTIVHRRRERVNDIQDNVFLKSRGASEYWSDGMNKEATCDDEEEEDEVVTSCYSGDSGRNAEVGSRTGLIY